MSIRGLLPIVVDLAPPRERPPPLPHGLDPAFITSRKWKFGGGGEGKGHLTNNVVGSVRCSLENLYVTYVTVFSVVFLRGRKFLESRRKP